MRLFYFHNYLSEEAPQRKAIRQRKAKKAQLASTSKLKRKTIQRDERDKFTDKEIKTLFSKNNYLHFTELELKKYGYYWCPLISLFSGMRLNEICALYLDNIIGIQGNHRKKQPGSNAVITPSVAKSIFRSVWLASSRQS